MNGFKVLLHRNTGCATLSTLVVLDSLKSTEYSRVCLDEICSNLCKCRVDLSFRCDQFQQCPCLPVHYTPLATASAPIYLSLPTRAGERSLSKPTGTAAAPTAQVQRLNNWKHVQYINISADSNLSMGKAGFA